MPMSTSLSLSKKTLLAASILSATTAQAGLLESLTLSDSALYQPRVTGQFLAGGEQQLGGFADAMIPVWQRADRFWFADASAMLGQSQRQTYSAGLGARSLYQKPSHQGIVGAFAFVDYYHTARNNEFLQLNPGVEWLTTNHEVRLQGYLPLNDKSQRFANTLASTIPAFATNESQKSASDLFGATGHRIIDTPVALVEEVGPGFEVEAGKRFHFGLEQDSWVRIGAYHFGFKDADDIYGVQANIEMPLNQTVSLLVQNNYDNQNHNRFSVGLRASFGGAKAAKNTLEHRMTAPIIRHQARQSYGEKDPIRLNFERSGASFDLVSNAWFFSPKGTAPQGEATTFQDCTAENPCLTIDSPTALRIQQLDPGANLLFETGSYTIPEGSPRIAYLHDGQSVLGRNLGWISPAFGANRPVVNGGLFWGDASIGDFANGTLNNMVVVNDNQLVAADNSGFSRDAVIAAGAAGTMRANDSSLTAVATTAVASNNLTPLALFGQNIEANRTDALARGEGDVRVFAAGFYAFNDASVVGGSQMGRATSEAGESIAYGIIANRDATVQNANTSGVAASNGGVSQAFSVRALNNAMVTGGTYTAQASTVAGGTSAAVGIFVGHDAIVENANTSGVAASSGGASEAFSVFAFNNATVTGGTHTAQVSTVNGNANAFGIRAFNDATVMGGTHTVEANSNAGNALARGVNANNQASVDGAIIKAIAESSTGNAEAEGVRALSGTVTNSTITVQENPGTGQKCSGVTSPDGDGSCS